MKNMDCDLIKKSNIERDLDHKLDKLRGVEFFKKIPDVMLKKLILDCKEIHLKPGEILFKENELAKSMYVILAGEVIIYKSSKVIAKRGPCEFIGDFGILESTYRSAKVESKGESSVLEITNEKFLNYFASNVQVLLSFLKTISKRYIQELQDMDSIFRKFEIRIEELEEKKPGA